jgi:hypothetical protein
MLDTKAAKKRLKNNHLAALIVETGCMRRAIQTIILNIYLVRTEADFDRYVNLKKSISPI